MLDFGYYNIDCMDGMKQFPDKYFDLAIVDPVYGDVKVGGYMNGKSKGGVGPHPKYNYSIWSQEKTGQDYFDELFRVSKNQIILVVTILRKKLVVIVPAGLFGINVMVIQSGQIVNLHGLHSILQ